MPTVSHRPPVISHVTDSCSSLASDTPMSFVGHWISSPSVEAPRSLLWLMISLPDKRNQSLRPLPIFRVFVREFFRHEFVLHTYPPDKKRPHDPSTGARSTFSHLLRLNILVVSRSESYGRVAGQLENRGRTTVVRIFGCEELRERN